MLETAIAMGIPYVDVCDDAEYAQACKRLHQRAVDAKVPAITTAGIYPGELHACSWYHACLILYL